MITPTATPTLEKKYPRTWMEPFLQVYSYCGNIEQAAAIFKVSRRSVIFQLERHPGFASAFAAEREKIAEHLWQTIRLRVPLPH